MPGPVGGAISGALKSAWAAVTSLFSETPAKGPCIPCAAARKPIVGPQWEKAAGDVFPGQQSYGNCGVQSARQLVEQAKGKVNKTEKQFLDDAVTSCSVSTSPDPTQSGGSNSAKRRCIMQQYGVSSSIADANIANVDAALRDGKGVIITADAKTLWATQGIPGPSGMHAVVITNGIYDSTGKLTGVDINDTGVGTRYALSTQELDTAMKSGTGLMNVTDDRIWPTN